MHRKTYAFLPLTSIRRATVLCPIILISILAAFIPVTHAAEATLAWDANSETDLAGYVIYYGYQTGNYEYSIDVGNQTTYTVTGLEENKAIYFVATAYNTDGIESGYSNEVVFEAENLYPTSDAGPDQNVGEGVSVTMTGANSFDPEGRTLSYEWQQTAGTVSVTLSNADSVAPSFTAPDVDQDGVALTFQLKVTDDLGLSAYDYCIINVVGSNKPPTADAGSDVTVSEGEEVDLDGFGSSDPDDGIASFSWEQIGGPGVTLTDPNAETTYFTAPSPTSEGVSLVFELTVKDTGGLTATDTCVVNVSSTHTAPTADAGSDQTAVAGDTVQLDGSDSTDPDDGIASIRWSEKNGTPVTLSDPKILNPTFTAPSVEKDETLVFELTITDKAGLVSQDTCLVTLDGDAEDTAPTLNISANNSEGTVEVFRRKPVSISISIDPGSYAGETVDVWLMVNTSNGRLFYVDGIGWETASVTYLDTPLETIASEKVFQDKIPVGNYTFTLAIDDNADGILDATWSDTVSVEVW